MSPILAALSVPILILLPGYSLLPRACPRRLRLPFVIFSSVVVTSVLGLALMLAGCFGVPLLAIIEAPLLLLRVRAKSWPSLALATHLPVLILAAAAAVFAILTAGEPFDATGDAGVYTISALHLSQTGRWTWPIHEVIPEGVPEDLVVYEPPYVRPWREVAPGFIVRGQHVVPQFFPLYPLWGAVFAAWTGIRGVLATNILGALMLLLGCSVLFRLLLGRAWQVAGLAAIVLNPIFLVFLKYPSAEVFLAGLLAGWLLWMVFFLRRPTAVAAVMPAALLALAVLTKFFAWAVAGAAGIVLVLMPWRRLGTAAVFAAAVLPAVAIDLWLATPHLENHLGQLLLLAGFKAIAIGCGLILLLRVAWSRLLRVVPLDLGVLYPIALVFLWGSARNHNVGDYAVLSGALVVCGAAGGVLWYLWRRRTIWLVLPAFVFVLLSLYLFLGSGDSPFYPFAARRYLPITVPLGALFVIYLVRQLVRAARRLRGVNRQLTAVASCVLLAAALLPPLWVQRGAVLVEQGKGFLAAVDELERVIPVDRTVLATGRAWRYSPHLLLLRNRPVYCLDLQTVGVLARVADFVEQRPDTLLLSAEKRQTNVLARVEVTRREIKATTKLPLRAARPRTVVYSLFSVGHQWPNGSGKVDVGSDDQLLVAGCFPGERANDRSFRWTGGNARILIATGAQVRFVWSRGGNPQKPLPVAVFARGQHLGDAQLTDGWQTSRWFDLPAGEGAALVEIRVPTFQPALVGPSDDHRHLGLQLDLVEIR